MRAGVATWRVAAAALFAAAVQAAPAQADWRDVAVRDSPRSAIASCLRATGAPGLVGLLGPLERRAFRFDLVRTAPGAPALVAGVSLGELLDCPAVAADPGGHMVVAAPVDRPRQGALRVALAAPGQGFGVPVTLAPGRAYPDSPVAAISPRGDAIVAWIARHEADGTRGPETSRVAVALRPAGGSFGNPQYLTPARSIESLDGARLAAANDASGAATVAWANPNVGVASAPPGGRFGPAQALTRGAHEISAVALAVSPDGAALLAYDSAYAIRLLERPAAGARFGRIAKWTSDRDLWQAPVVALAPDGSAVVGWRREDPVFSPRGGVVMTARRGHAAFSKPRVVWPGREPRDTADAYVLATTRGGVAIPSDEANRGLRVALAANGLYVLTWAAPRVSPLGDMPAAAAIVSGVVGAPPRPVTFAGCRCRDVNGVGPMALPGGGLGVAFTDNVTSWLTPRIELARAAGRLHLATLGAPFDPPPPKIAVTPLRPATLRYEQELAVAAHCDGPCDLRAYVLDGDGAARGVGTARLRQAGRTRVKIRPSLDGHLAPRGGVRVRVLVRAWTPGGRTYAEASTRVVLRRASLRPLPRVLSARAVRRGGAIVVTWLTSRPLRGNLVVVEARNADRHSLGLFAFRYAQNQSRFRVRLRSRPALRTDFDQARWVSITVVRAAPPHDHRRVFVPISG